MTEYEIVEKIVTVRIPVPPELLVQPELCFFPMTGKLYVFDLDEYIGCMTSALNVYFRQVEQIKKTQQAMPPGGD